MHFVTLTDSFKIPNRYDFQRFLNFSDDTFDVQSSYFLQEVKNLPIAGVYLVVDSVKRPDNISYDIFNGDTQFYWLLMYYNDILDFQQIALGTEIKYFSLEDLENLFFSLKQRAFSYG